MYKRNLHNLAKSSECSRVISFDSYVDRLEYTSGALFVVKSTMTLETITDRKTVGLKAKNVEFGFDKTTVEPQYFSELDQVASFLKQHPTGYAVIDGYTDPSGDFEYNMRLSRRRAESVVEYLMYKHKDFNMLVGIVSLVVGVAAFFAVFLFRVPRIGGLIFIVCMIIFVMGSAIESSFHNEERYKEIDEL